MPPAPRPVLRAALPALLLLALPACSAGTDTPVPRGVGHGGVADVLKVLQEQGSPCEDPQPQPPDYAVAEESSRCTFEGEQIEVLHFVAPEQAAKFKDTTLAAGDHGAFAETWGARTPSEETAEALAALVEETSTG